jgi:hypothetical protein
MLLLVMVFGSYKLHRCRWSGCVENCGVGGERCGSPQPARLEQTGAWCKHEEKKSYGDVIVLCYCPVYLLYLYSSRSGLKGTSDARDKVKSTVVSALHTCCLLFRILVYK